jgi:predicted transcriptional regulator
VVTTNRLLATSAEAVVHDFFRDNSNYFHDLEVAAEALRATEACEPDDIYAALKARLLNTHGIRIKRRTTEEMTQALRVYDNENRVIYLSEALDYSNVVFQLAHVLCLVELRDPPAYNVDDERMFSQIGINCHVCPRQACSQRAHQPLFMDLPLDTNRRGKTRYES